jgi:hypothetical protein
MSAESYTHTSTHTKPPKYLRKYMLLASFFTATNSQNGVHSIKENVWQGAQRQLLNAKPLKLHTRYELAFRHMTDEKPVLLLLLSHHV